jgi:hypothetical protein
VDARGFQHRPHSGPSPKPCPVLVTAAEPSMETHARRKVAVQREAVADGDRPLKSALVRDICGIRRRQRYRLHVIDRQGWGL